MEIALVGVVCASCVLGAVVIASGQGAGQQLESIFAAGLSRSGGTLVVNGTVVATTGGEAAAVDEIVFTVGTVGEPPPLVLDALSEGERLVIGFRSETAFDFDVLFAANEIVGDHDGVLEAGETAEIRLTIAEIGDGGVVIGPSDAWTLQLSAPYGGIVEVSRTMPFALDRVNSLR
jgi:hypothetical protein